MNTNNSSLSYLNNLFSYLHRINDTLLLDRHYHCHVMLQNIVKIIIYISNCLIFYLPPPRFKITSRCHQLNKSHCTNPNCYDTYSVPNDQNKSNFESFFLKPRLTILW